MELARTSVPTELRSLRYLLFNSAIPAPILLRLLRLVTADVTRPLQKRSMFTRAVTLVTAVTPQIGPAERKGLRKHIFKLWTLDFGLYLG